MFSNTDGLGSLIAIIFTIAMMLALGVGAVVGHWVLP
jgi:hypothetical protein